MLRADGGATIDEDRSPALGWRAHPVRGAMSGRAQEEAASVTSEKRSRARADLQTASSLIPLGSRALQCRNVLQEGGSSLFFLNTLY